MADGLNPDTATPQPGPRTTFERPIADDRAPISATVKLDPESMRLVFGIHPNTVGYSAGAVCCPDETSAWRHQHRATWWDADAKPEGGYVGPRWDPLTEQVVAHYRWQYGPRRRWTS